MRQELRVAVWQALAKHDPAKMPLKPFVFALVRNRVSTLRRGSMRRTAREGIQTDVEGEHFDGRSRNYVARDEVYGKIDGGLLVLPATLTAREADVLVMLMMEMTRTEIARALSVKRTDVDLATFALRAKMSDWRPEAPNSSRTVALAA